MLILLVHRKVFPNVSTSYIKVSGQEIELIGGIRTKKAPPTSLSTPSPPNSLKTATKLQTYSKGQSLSPPPSRSPPPPPPSPSLSPLQQLIQATKSQNSVTKYLPNPSPLLHSKKVPTGLILKKPQGNGGAPLSVSSSSVRSFSALSRSAPNDETLSSSSVGVNNDMGMRKPASESIGMSPVNHLVNGMNDGMDILKMKTFAAGKRERIEDNFTTTKKPKNELLEITNRTWTLNYDSLHSVPILATASRSSHDDKSIGSSTQRSVSPDEKGSTSLSLLSTVSTPLLKPVSVTSLTDNSEAEGTTPLLSDSKFTCLWDNCLS